MISQTPQQIIGGDQYKTIVKIPLPMAYLTTYLEGTDKQRPNAFELKAVDGSTTGKLNIFKIY